MGEGRGRRREHLHAGSIRAESVVRTCGRWKRIMPSRSCSEHDLRHSLSIFIGCFAHSPLFARASQSDL